MASLEKILRDQIARGQNVIDDQRKEVDRLRERLRKYEDPGPLCNSGHVNVLPLKLWTCPMCCDRDGRKIVAADIVMLAAVHAIAVCGLEESLAYLEADVLNYRRVK